MAFVHRSVLCRAALFFAFTILVVLNCGAYQAPSARRSSPAMTAQSNAQKTPASNDWTAEFAKNPELWTELGKLVSRMQQEVQLPGMRRQSKILPRLDNGTEIYMAFPNYGESLNQAHVIFKQQLRDSPKLTEWWQKSELNKSDPKFDDVLEQLYQVSQYLGDEIVVAGSYKNKNGVLMAEVKKPGLETFLPEMYRKMGGKSAGKLTVVTPQELATLKAGGKDDAIALVRPDFLVIGTDLAALRTLNAQIDSGKKGFAATPFGQRMNQAYVDGVGSVIGVDLQSMIPDFAKQDSDRAMLQASGFADLKYAVWEMNDHKGGGELSFTGPRHGIASWLANSGPMGGLDFLSPAATMAGSVLLKSPAQIFDDFRDLALSMNPKSLDSLAQMQMAMGIDLRNDLLSKLDGEIAFEMDVPLEMDPAHMDQAAPVKPVPATPPTWRLALRVNDPQGVQQTLTKLLAASHMQAKDQAAGKYTVHTIEVPSGPEPLRISYTFADGYMVAGSSRAALSEALRVHQTGESLAKSARLRTALPDNQALIASAIQYQNMGSWMRMFAKQLPANIAQMLPQMTAEMTPTVSAVYGTDRAIKSSGGSNSTSVAAVLIGAAIAIPNLQRAKGSANEAGAASSLRTINTAQVVYFTSYPNKGYAPDLATLGPGTSGGCDDPKSVTEKRACLLSDTLGGPTCTAGSWCKKDGYNFSVRTVCRFGTCPGYVAVATPATNGSGTKSFCSVEDAVIRFMIGAPVSGQISAAECKRWTAIR